MAIRKMPRPLGYHWDQKEPVVRADGFKPCRWCKGPVKPPNRMWCGDKVCIHEWKRRTSWPLTRDDVFRRDRGICALCGLDTKTVDPGIILGLITKSRKLQPEANDHRRAMYEQLEAAYAWGRLNKCESPWQADHIIPVNDGGDWFAMSNLRTLCCPCHRRVTTEYATHRATERRGRRSKRVPESIRSPVLISDSPAGVPAPE